MNNRTRANARRSFEIPRMLDLSYNGYEYELREVRAKYREYLRFFTEVIAVNN